MLHSSENPKPPPRSPSARDPLVRGSNLGVLWDELERGAVVAPALVGGRRAVVEEVAVVAAAALAVVFGARVDEEEVFLGLEYARNGSEERRPARAGLVFHFGSEERQVAARAGKDARALLGVERAGTGALGRLFAQHLVGEVVRQTFLPLVLRKLERLRWRGHVKPGRQQGLPVGLQGLNIFHGFRLRIAVERRNERHRADSE